MFSSDNIQKIKECYLRQDAYNSLLDSYFVKVLGNGNRYLKSIAFSEYEDSIRMCLIGY